jgi:hypothetical protein
MTLDSLSGTKNLTILNTDIFQAQLVEESPDKE